MYYNYPSIVFLYQCILIIFWWLLYHPKSLYFYNYEVVITLNILLPITYFKKLSDICALQTVFF